MFESLDSSKNNGANRVRIDFKLCTHSWAKLVHDLDAVSFYVAELIFCEINVDLPTTYGPLFSHFLAHAICNSRGKNSMGMPYLEEVKALSSFHHPILSNPSESALFFFVFAFE